MGNSNVEYSNANVKTTERVIDKSNAKDLRTDRITPYSFVCGSNCALIFFSSLYNLTTRPGDAYFLINKLMFGFSKHKKMYFFSLREEKGVTF
jgi:hypothetical protein